MADDDILKEAREAFQLCQDHEAENREEALDDLRFARLEEQWPKEVEEKRRLEGRPCLTINRLPTFIRQVVNDGRQNRPAITVHPADSNSDPQTAEIMSGLIRNIEQSSNADAAYDTALESAVSGGLGYFKIGYDYAYDDSFDQELQIERVSDPFAIYGDPHSREVDSSDWNVAFEVEPMSKATFERRFKGADAVDWAADYGTLEGPWIEEDRVLLASYWMREEVEGKLLALSNGQFIDAKSFEAVRDQMELAGVQVVGERPTRTHKVKRRLITGAEVLEEIDWPGCYIPIIPVYGDEVVVEGKRYFRSLIRSAKDAQRMFNYHRSASVELLALQPKTPFIGPKGAFETDAEKWATANTDSHAFIEYDGPVPPQRQPFAGPASGALQEALNASDDMKSIMGLYDASLGRESNETSGRAIMARQREGDVATFHFIDNLSRSIRHAGRVLIDLIPKIYNKERIVRVMGEDGTPSTVPLKQPVQQQDGTQRIYDLGLGKYDLTVKAGPSFTSRREEAASQMIELWRALPQAAAVTGDIFAKNLDWPGADEIAERLKAMLPPQAQGQDPRLQQAQQAMQQLQAQGQKLVQENEALKADKSAEVAKLQLEARKLEIEEFKAQTDRMEAEAKIVSAQQPRGFPADEMPSRHP